MIINETRSLGNPSKKFKKCGKFHTWRGADPNVEFPREIYFIDRKTNENREVVSWELAAVFDLAGIRSPKRQCTRSLFPSIGTFNQ